MSYELINSLGNAIDDVYNNTYEGNGRKTVAQLRNDCLEISFRTIINIAREKDLQDQIILLKKEANDLISQRLKTIEKSFKESSGRDLVSKKISENDGFETLTVSPYSHLKTLKYTLKYCYEVK